MASDTAKFVVDVDGKTAGLDRVRDALGRFTKTTEGVKAPVAGVQNALGGLSQTAGQLPGPLGSVASGIEGLVGRFKEFAALGPAGIIAAVAVALIALVAAVGLATIALAKFGLEAADTKRATLLAFEGLLGTAEAARELDDAISNLRHHTAVATDRLEEIGKVLAFAGARGTQLQDVLRELAKVESTAGSAAVNKYLKRIKAGEDLSKIMDEIRKKGLADVGERQAAGFGQQLKDLHDDIADLFEDINIEPFLEGLRSVLMLFSDQTVAGQALKEMITSFFSGFFKIVSAVFPYVKAFLQGFIIGVLKVYTALVPVGRAIAQAFGGKPNAGLIDFFVFLGKAAAYVGAVIAAIATVFMVAWAVMSFVAGLLMGAPLAIIAAWGILIAGISAIWDGIVGIFSGAGEAAYNFIMGLANGISAGASAVVGAAIGVAKGAVDAVKGALGIASPSKVMMEMGVHTAEGFAGGVDASAGGAQESMSSMVAPPAAAGGGATTNSSASSVVVNVSPGAVVIQGGGGGGAESQIDAAFTSLAERIAASMGARVAA